MDLEGINLNKMNYDKVRRDLTAFEKFHLNKEDRLQDKKKKTLASKL